MNFSRAVRLLTRFWIGVPVTAHLAAADKAHTDLDIWEWTLRIICAGAMLGMAADRPGPAIYAPLFRMIRLYVVEKNVLPSNEFPPAQSAMMVW